MKITSRIILLVCIAWLFVFMVIRSYEMGWLNGNRPYDRNLTLYLLSISHLVLCVGSFLFQLLKLKLTKHNPLLMDAALDNEFVTSEPKPGGIKSPKILKITNVLFGIWICFLCVGLTYDFLSRYNSIRVSISLLASYFSILYCLVFIVGGGAVKFFSVDENSTF